LERSEISLGRSPVTFDRIVEKRYSFRHVEKSPSAVISPNPKRLPPSWAICVSWYR
jgi:hypothetical protein